MEGLPLGPGEAGPELGCASGAVVGAASGEEDGGTVGDEAVVGVASGEEGGGTAGDEAVVGGGEPAGLVEAAGGGDAGGTPGELGGGGGGDTATADGEADGELLGPGALLQQPAVTRVAARRSIPSIMVEGRRTDETGMAVNS